MFYEFFNEPATYRNQLGPVRWEEWKRINEDPIAIVRAHDGVRLGLRSDPAAHQPDRGGEYRLRYPSLLQQEIAALGAEVGRGFRFRRRAIRRDGYRDRERAKVVNDLVFGERVKGLALVKTDGRMAVLLLQ